MEKIDIFCIKLQNYGTPSGASGSHRIRLGTNTPGHRYMVTGSHTNWEFFNNVESAFEYAATLQVPTNINPEWVDIEEFEKIINAPIQWGFGAAERGENPIWRSLKTENEKSMTPEKLKKYIDIAVSMDGHLSHNSWVQKALKHPSNDEDSLIYMFRYKKSLPCFAEEWMAETATKRNYKKLKKLLLKSANWHAMRVFDPSLLQEDREEKQKEESEWNNFLLNL